MTTLSVVVPVFNGRDYLAESLVPLAAALQRGDVCEVLVVDDGSSDGSDELCRELGIEVARTPTRSGPAAARNLGAQQASGDIVLFVDCDVVIHDDVPRLVQETFDTDVDCVAMFGSYDDDPPDRGFASTYANLRHHWIHQRGAGRAHTFWAGCGAVRRADFQAIGGYDPSRYGQPSIEDIELGMRLDQRGTIRLRGDVLGTHLKRWTVRSLIATDIWQRAIPWSRLLFRQTERRHDLNLNRAERAKAMVAGLLVASLVISPLFPPAIALAAALAVVAWIANAGFFGLIWRRRGALHACAGFALHQLYYVYSTLAFAYVAVQSTLRPRPTDRASGSAISKP